MYATSISPRAPYDFSPTSPLGVPSVISLAFFGGLWGILIWHLIEKLSHRAQIIRAIIYGAAGPSIIALAIVFPLKGKEVQMAFIPLAFLLNGVWGLGLWLLMYPWRKYKNA